MKKRCLVAVNARRAIEGRRPSMLSRPHLPVLPMIERLVTDRSQRVAVAGLLQHRADERLSYMGDADKANLVAMQQWASTPDC